MHNNVIVQVEVQNFQARSFHSAAAFSLSPGLTEITIFGGCLQNAESDADLSQVANTTVLRFGKCAYAPCVCPITLEKSGQTMHVVCSNPPHATMRIPGVSHVSIIIHLSVTYDISLFAWSSSVQ